MPDEFEGPKTSFLTSALSVSPIAVGAGIGVHKLLRSGTRLLDPATAREAVFKETVDKMLSRSITQPPISTSFIPPAGEADEAVREAWKLAQKRMDPLLLRNLRFAKNLEGMEPSAVTSAIMNELQRNNSLAMRRAASQFEQNLAVLTRQQGPIPKFVSVQAPKIVSNRSFIPADIVPYMNRIKALSGGATTHFYDQPGRPGAGLFVVNIAHGNRGFQVTLPIADPVTGLMSEGLYGQVARIAPPLGVIDKTGQLARGMSRHQYFMEEFTQTVLPRIESGKLFGPAIESELSQLYEDIFRAQETINISKSGVGASYARLRSQQVDLVLENFQRGERDRLFRPPTEAEFEKALRVNKGWLFGGTSPAALARGRASMFDISRLGIGSSAMDWSARYEQGFRKWTLAAASQEKLAARAGMEHFAALTTPETKGLFGGSELLPRFRTLYVDPEKHADVLKQFGIGEGEALATRAAGKLMEWQTPTKTEVKLVNEEVLKLVQSGDFDALKGRIIGTNTGTGTLFTLGKNVEEVSARLVSGGSVGDVLSLEYLETRKTGLAEKFFGDMKATIRFVKGEEFGAALQRIGVPPATSGFEVIATMNMLRKNRMLHNEQMISDLFDTMMRRNDLDALKRNSKLAAFLENPVTVGRGLMRQVTKGDIYNHDQMITELMNLGKAAKLTKPERELVFGAVPFVTGKEGGRGIAGGVSRLAIDEPMYGNVRGSIEPRGFIALHGGALGELGEGIAADVSNRLAILEADKLLTHQQLNKSVLSMLGNESVRGADRMIEEFAGQPGRLSEALEKFVKGGGGYLRIGEGFGDVYVPGAETISAMREYTTAAGKDVRSSIYHIYENLIRGASRMYTDVDQVSPRDFRKSTFLPAVRKLKYHEAPAGKGIGAFLRGKILGSRYLYGVSEFGDWAPQPGVEGLFTVGVSEKRGLQMLQEMELSGLYDKQQMAGMRKRFTTGYGVGGVINRHPFIGPYSQQPISIRMVRGGQPDLVAISEAERTIKLAGGETAPIKFGPLVGLAGDKDADRFSVMMLAPDMEKKARQAILSNDTEYMKAYTQHQIKYQLMKTRRAAYQGEINTIESMVAGSTKLGTVERHVRKLSTEITRARAAVGSYLTGAERANTDALLEWLEQTPISAKHFGVAGGAKTTLGASLEQLISGLKQEDVKYGTQQIRQAMNEIFADSARGVLGETLSLDPKTARTLGISPQMRGMDVDKTLQDIVSSSVKFRRTKQAGMFEQAMGRVSRTSQQEMLLHSRRLAEGISNAGLMSKVRSATGAVNNVLAAAGKGIRHMAAPLGLGFAAAIGLSAVLSEPKQSIGPGRALNPTRASLKYSKAANRMKPSDMHPSPPTMGSPSSPDMLRQRNVRISNPSPSPSVHVKTRGNYFINGPNIADQIRQATGRHVSVGVNIRDDKHSLSKYAQGNKSF